MKKFLSIVLSAIMMLAMSSLALAADYSSHDDGSDFSDYSGSSASGGSSASSSSTKTAASIVSTTTVDTAIKSASGTATISGNAVASSKVMETIAASSKAVTFKATNYTIKIDPKTVTTAQNISLGAKPANEAVEKIFSKYFDNKFASVSLSQKGEFGATVEITIKPTNIAQLNTGSLKFFSYDSAANKYSEIKTAYNVNTDGSITFSTPIGNDIVITDAPITAK